MKTQELLTQIGEALADDANDLARQRGVNACRMVMTVLDAKEGEVLAVAPAPALPTPPASPLATAAHAMANIPPGAILDAVIAKLQATLPPDASNAEPDPAPLVLRIPFIPVPNLKGRGT